MKTTQYQPLHQTVTDVERSPSKDVWRSRFYWLLSVYTTVTVFIVLILVYTLSASDSHSCTPGARKPYSPVTLHIEYVNRYMTSDPDTPKFMGKARPELDEAWHNLLEGTMIRFTAEELKLANNASSVAYMDGGYVGGLGISHSLHCLKRLKQYFYKDYYYSHKDQDWDELESHADHCIESLRQSLLCSADISVYTLEWTPHSRVKPTVRVPQPHACVDWPKLHSWMKSRAASLDKMVPPPDELYDSKKTVS